MYNTITKTIIKTNINIMNTHDNNNYYYKDQ